MSELVEILKSIGFKKAVLPRCPFTVYANDWVYHDGEDDIYYRLDSRLICAKGSTLIEIADNQEEIKYYLLTMLRNKRLKEFNICWN